MQIVKRILAVGGILAALLFSVWQIGRVGAATAEVACTGDSLVVSNTNSSGAGSLRQAIEDVCTEGEISFDSSLSGQKIDVSPDGSLTISKTVTIDGSNLAEPVWISGNRVVRVLFISPTGVLTLTHVVIAEGAVPTAGFDCSMICGAGIFVEFDGQLTLQNSTVMSNTASGGAALLSSGTTVILNSTFQQNVSLFEGSAIRTSGAMTIANSTFSGNVSQDAPGGVIYNAVGNLTLYHNTIAYNEATAVRAIFHGSGSLMMGNNMIGQNSGMTDCVTQKVLEEIPSLIAFNANNLIEDGSCAADFSGAPLLAPLADNGGDTLTHLIIGGRPPLALGDPAVCGNEWVGYLDQRGVARPQDKPCDLGAFELDESLLFLPLIYLSEEIDS